MKTENTHRELKKEVCLANLDLFKLGLVKMNWGNASVIDREHSVMFIKPSGVDYESLDYKQMVEVDLQTGDYNGDLRPSSDTPTHLYLYKHFHEIKAIVHTHSFWATTRAQACREIPCYGTTHADHFFGTIPVTRSLHPEEIKDNYEENTGLVIIERFSRLNPVEMPGVLVAEHGPFTWGSTIREAVQHALILEEVSRMAFTTETLGKVDPISDSLLEKHYRRKHGISAYYGQKPED